MIKFTLPPVKTIRVAPSTSSKPLVVAPVPAPAGQGKPPAIKLPVAAAAIKAFLEAPVEALDLIGQEEFDRQYAEHKPIPALPREPERIEIKPPRPQLTMPQADQDDVPLGQRDETRTVRREWAFNRYRLRYVWPVGHKVLVLHKSDRIGMRYVQFSPGTRLLMPIKEIEEMTI